MQATKIENRVDSPLPGLRADPHDRVIAKERRIIMPTGTAIIVAGITLVFTLFALALAWADYYTRDVRMPGAVYFHKPK